MSGWSEYYIRTIKTGGEVSQREESHPVYDLSAETLFVECGAAPFDAYDIGNDRATVARGLRLEPMI